MGGGQTLCFKRTLFCQCFKRTLFCQLYVPSSVNYTYPLLSIVLNVPSFVSVLNFQPIKWLVTRLDKFQIYLIFLFSTYYIHEPMSFNNQDTKLTQQNIPDPSAMPDPICTESAFCATCDIDEVCYGTVKRHPVYKVSHQIHSARQQLLSMHYFCRNPRAALDVVQVISRYEAYTLRFVTNIKIFDDINGDWAAMIMKHQKWEYYNKWIRIWKGIEGFERAKVETPNAYKTTVDHWILMELLQ